MAKSQVQAGDLLLSEPFLPDPNFKRTVVFMSEHNKAGSVGFVLNRPTDLKLPDVLHDVPDFEAPLFYGGPVQPETLHYFHRKGNLLKGSVKVKEGLYWGGNFEMLKLLLEGKQLGAEDIRFFLGYSGWAPGQLEDEMERKSWITAKGHPRHVFEDDPDKLWQAVLEELGGDYKVVAKFPEDPLLN